MTSQVYVVEETRVSSENYQLSPVVTGNLPIAPAWVFRNSGNGERHRAISVYALDLSAIRAGLAIMPGYETVAMVRDIEQSVFMP